MWIYLTRDFPNALKHQSSPVIHTADHIFVRLCSAIGFGVHWIEQWIPIYFLGAFSLMWIDSFFHLYVNFFAILCPIACFIGVTGVLVPVSLSMLIYINDNIQATAFVFMGIKFTSKRVRGPKSKKLTTSHSWNDDDNLPLWLLSLVALLFIPLIVIDCFAFLILFR